MNNEYSFFDQDIITRFDGTKIIDKYAIFDGISNRESRNRLVYDLYYELGYLPLTYIISSISKSYKLFDDKKNYTDSDLEKLFFIEIEKTLEYLYSILKEGKLDCRIIKYKKVGENKYETESFRVYKKEEAKECIEKIREGFFKCKTDKDRVFFVEGNVQFKLPENEWIY